MSDESGGVSKQLFGSFGFLMSVLTLAALIGNIICFKMTRRLLKSKPSLILVLNLNISDIIVAVVSWTAFMLQHIASAVAVDIDILVHKLFWSILVGLGNVTLLTLTGLAGDCFVALRWPLEYKRIATCRCVNIYILVIWVCSTLSGASDFIKAGCNMESRGSFTEALRDTMVFTGRGRKELLTASLTILISNSLSLACLLGMVVMYGYILNKIRRIQSNHSLSEIKLGSGLKSDIRAVRTTLMIFTSFLLLWLPTLIVNIISAVHPNFIAKLSFTEASIIGYTADTLLMVHSIVDAVIYGKRVNKTIRRHKKSRRDQREYSRANTTLRRQSTCTNASERSPRLHQEDGLLQYSGQNLQVPDKNRNISKRREEGKSITTISDTVEMESSCITDLSKGDGTRELRQSPNTQTLTPHCNGVTRENGNDNGSFSLDEAGPNSSSALRSQAALTVADLINHITGVQSGRLASTARSAVSRGVLATVKASILIAAAFPLSIRTLQLDDSKTYEHSQQRNGFHKSSNLMLQQESLIGEPSTQTTDDKGENNGKVLEWQGLRGSENKAVEPMAAQNGLTKPAEAAEEHEGRAEDDKQLDDGGKKVVNRRHSHRLSVTFCDMQQQGELSELIISSHQPAEADEIRASQSIQLSLEPVEYSTSTSKLYLENSREENFCKDSSPHSEYDGSVALSCTRL